jgi:hypothetical protein
MSHAGRFQRMKSQVRVTFGHVRPQGTIRSLFPDTEEVIGFNPSTAYQV